MTTPWEPYALIAIALTPSALAIAAGWAGLRAVRRHPEELRGRAAAVAGISLGWVTLLLNGMALFLCHDLLWEGLALYLRAVDGDATGKAEVRVTDTVPARADNPAYAAYLQGRWSADQDARLALEHFNESLSYDPTFGPALLERARLLLQFSDYRGAVQDLDALLRLEPENAEGFRLRGRARQEDQDLPGAISDWQRYLQLDPGGRFVLEARQEIRALENRLQGK